MKLMFKLGDAPEVSEIVTSTRASWSKRMIAVPVFHWRYDLISRSPAPAALTDGNKRNRIKSDEKTRKLLEFTRNISCSGD